MTTVINALQRWFYSNIGAILIWLISVLFIAGAAWSNFNTRLTTVEAASITTEQHRVDDRTEILNELKRMNNKVDEINIYLRGK